MLPSSWGSPSRWQDQSGHGGRRLLELSLGCLKSLLYDLQLTYSAMGLPDPEPDPEPDQANKEGKSKAT